MNNQNYDIIAGELTTKRIQLEIQRIAFELRFDPRGLSRNTEIEFAREEMSRQLVARMVSQVAARKYDVKTVRFPKDWWQAFKKQFFPMWALVRWPVQYEEITMEANAYYPEIEIPDKQAFVEVCIHNTHFKNAA